MKPSTSRDVHVRTPNGECTAGKILGVNKDGTVDLIVWPLKEPTGRLYGVPEERATGNFAPVKCQLEDEVGYSLPRETNFDIRWHEPERV